jgi:NAD(P)-dependent dehydrogenase (short-subunit alcohol dehydrogenase family)
MKERTFIVTGGNAGIGKAIATALAQMQAHVVIISRNAQKGEQAREEIQAASRNSQVDLVVGDLGTIEQTRRLASVLLERYPTIHVLINNAGVWMTRRTLNADGLETCFMVNHMAPFILSTLLLERLKENAPSRIVNVNAGLYVFGKLDLEKTPFGHDFGRLKTYMNTKLCNILFTCELARRIEGSGVTVNALHPGVIRTNLGISPGILGVFVRIAKRFFDTPEEGARAPVWLATAPELEGVSGKYFDVKKETELTETAKDAKLACDLWDLSAKLAGMSASP